MSYMNFANGYSVEQVPVQANRNEYIPFYYISTGDITIDPSDNTKLICVNPGTWMATIQYQLVGIKDTDKAKYGTVDGWIRVNGVDRQNTDASA